MDSEEWNLLGEYKFTAPKFDSNGNMIEPKTSDSKDLDWKSPVTVKIFPEQSKSILVYNNI
jgi:hypothetical protein